ncbi:hypothetical protein ABPG74_012119 [Tetrahymena malaccensis]
MNSEQAPQTTVKSLEKHYQLLLETQNNTKYSQLVIGMVKQMLKYAQKAKQDASTEDEKFNADEMISEAQEQLKILKQMFQSSSLTFKLITKQRDEDNHICRDLFKNMQNFINFADGKFKQFDEEAKNAEIEAKKAEDAKKAEESKKDQKFENNFNEAAISNINPSSGKVQYALALLLFQSFFEKNKS